MDIAENTVRFLGLACLVVSSFLLFAFQEKFFVFLGFFSGILILRSTRSVVRVVEVHEKELRLIRSSSTSRIRWDQVTAVRTDSPPEGPGYLEIQSGEVSCAINCRFYVDGEALYRTLLQRLSHIEIESIAVANPGIMLPYFWLPLRKKSPTRDS